MPLIWMVDMPGNGGIDINFYHTGRLWWQGQRSRKDENSQNFLNQNVSAQGTHHAK